jgi:hypothetical protein
MPSADHPEVPGTRAFGIGSARFSEGIVCVPPDRPESVSSPVSGLLPGSDHVG